MSGLVMAVSRAACWNRQEQIWCLRGSHSFLKCRRRKVCGYVQQVRGWLMWVLGGFDVVAMTLLRPKLLLSVSCLSGRWRIADAVLVLIASGTLVHFQ